VLFFWSPCWLPMPGQLGKNSALPEPAHRSRSFRLGPENEKEKDCGPVSYIVIVTNILFPLDS
jgi:hypothetical protein